MHSLLMYQLVPIKRFWIDLFCSKRYFSRLTESRCNSRTKLRKEYFTVHSSAYISICLANYVYKVSNDLQLPDSEHPCREIFRQRPKNYTIDDAVAWQKQYLDLGLMHRVTFSDFLTAERLPNGALADELPLPVDWKAIESRWKHYLGDEKGVDLPFGLKGTHTTSINLPGVHYPGPPIGGVNHTLVDFLWHATGCTKQTPEWGYTYWGRSYDYGVSDMFVYCMHAEDGKNDSWSRTCGLLKRGDKCMRQPIPKAATNRTHNNTKAIKYWKAAAAHAKEAGWFIKMFDYTCDEPGADPSRYAACKSRANALHEGDRALKVMITAEKPSADASNISNLIDIWSPIINFIDSNRSLCPGYNVGRR